MQQKFIEHQYVLNITVDNKTTVVIKADKNLALCSSWDRERQAYT